MTTREDYLTAASHYLLDNLILPEANCAAPAFKVSIGWPKGSRGSKTMLGQCFPTSYSTAGVNEIFITPKVQTTSVALATLVHELIHATDNCQSGHKGHFAKVARACNLEGKLTATTAGPELQEVIDAYITQHGEMPHHAMLDPDTKKPGSRSLKLECSHCGFTARSTKKWIEQLPAEAVCPLCGEYELHAV